MIKIYFIRTWGKMDYINIFPLAEPEKKVTEVKAQNEHLSPLL